MDYGSGSFRDWVEVFMVSVPLTPSLGRIQPLSRIKLVTRCSQQVILVLLIYCREHRATFVLIHIGTYQVSPLGGRPWQGGAPPLPYGRWAPPFRWCLPEPSRVFLSWRFMYSLYVNLTCGPPFVLIPITPVEIDNHQNLWNSISDKPYSYIVFWFTSFLMLCSRLKRVFIYYQQTPPSLPFDRPWAKIDWVMDQELLQCFHASQVHKCSIEDSPQD